MSFPYANEEPSPNLGYYDSLEIVQAKYYALHEALECVKSALEDVGMDGSLAHEIATKAIKGAA